MKAALRLRRTHDLKDGLVHEATADVIACSFARGNDARARFVYVVEPVAAKNLPLKPKEAGRRIQLLLVMRLFRSRNL